MYSVRAIITLQTVPRCRALPSRRQSPCGLLQDGYGTRACVRDGDTTSFASGIQRQPTGIEWHQFSSLALTCWDLYPHTRSTWIELAPRPSLLVVGFLATPPWVVPRLCYHHHAHPLRRAPTGVLPQPQMFLMFLALGDHVSQTHFTPVSL